MDNTQKVDENYFGTDIPMSAYPKLDIMRFEARISILENRKASHGLSDKGERILNFCRNHLETLKN